jgi:hypothetical protein
MPKIIAYVVVFAVVGASAAARADAPPPPPPAGSGWDGNPTPPPAWNGAPPPAAQPPAYAPPPGYPPPYPYGAAPGYGGLNMQSMYLYESQKKSPALGLVLDLLIPGVGSIYADHPQGALITWGLMIGGIAAIVLADDHRQTSGDISRPDTNLIVAGVVMILGGRIYGIYDGYASSADYNRALAQRLGLPPGVALGIVPIRQREATAFGPTLSWRF